MSVRAKEAPGIQSGKVESGKKSLAERVAGLTPEQRELYESRRSELRRRELQKRELPKEEKPRIQRLEGRGPWPATTDQAALWFIQQLDPSTSAYNIGNGFRLQGRLDVALLERCLNEVAQR